MLRDLADLPPTVGTATAAELLGVSTDALYDAARRGDAPVEPLRVGRTMRWPTARIAEVLGIARGASDAAE